MAEDAATITETNETESQEEQKPDLGITLSPEETDEKGSDEDADKSVTEDKEETEGEDKGQESQEDSEVDIVLEDEEGSQPRKKLEPWVRSQIKKGKARYHKAEAENSEATARIVQLEQENKAMQEALQKETKIPEMPNAQDFETYPDGANDPKFQTDLTTHIVAKTQQQNMSNQHVQAQQIVQQRQQERNEATLKSAKETHYHKAAELSVPDYGDMEDKAAEVLGEDATNLIIMNAERPHEMLYFLGKNKGKAEEIRDELTADPFRGVMTLGRLESKIKVKSKKKIPADPDKKLEGGTLGGKKTERGPKGATFT